MTAPAKLGPIVSHADRLLKTASISDYDGAYNGLQVENDGRITRIAAAVDASLATVQMAVEAGADLLVVHHGLFWGPTVPWTGRRRELLRLLLANNLAVYSSHLPLDAHPKLGNNARIAAALGLRSLKPFFFSKGQFIGWKSDVRMTRAELATRLEKILGGPVRLLPGGGVTIRSLGICSGGAGSDLKLAARERVDAFITGEGPHWTFPLAEELGLNVYYGGHYATETFGVKALAAELGRKFKVPWTFLDHPSGL
jgi:dinuclear metal center YbgI/SA1388 family protein